MVDLYDLTQEQLDIKEDLIDTTASIGFCFMDAKYRNIGKSTILRDIGLEYQALGYKVYIVTPAFFSQEYIADGKLTSADSIRGISPNSIVLVDEMKLEGMDCITKYCIQRGVPIMWFTRYV